MGGWYLRVYRGLACRLWDGVFEERVSAVTFGRLSWLVCGGGGGAGPGPVWGPCGFWSTKGTFFLKVVILGFREEVSIPASPWGPLPEDT